MNEINSNKFMQFHKIIYNFKIYVARIDNIFIFVYICQNYVYA